MVPHCTMVQTEQDGLDNVWYTVGLVLHCIMEHECHEVNFNLYFYTCIYYIHVGQLGITAHVRITIQFRDRWYCLGHLYAMLDMNATSCAAGAFHITLACQEFYRGAPVFPMPLSLAQS